MRSIGLGGRRWTTIASCAVALLWASGAFAVESGKVIDFGGACGGSAAIPIDDDRFVVADDGSTDLLGYRYDSPAAPFFSTNVDKYLGIPRGRGTKSAALSGAARIGRRSFWIGSHARDDAGLLRFRHQRMLQMEVLVDDDDLRLRERGIPYVQLLDKMIMTPSIYRLGMASAVGARIKRKKELAPDQGGFAIEGLTQTKDALGVLIGLRSPMHDGKAIVVPLENPIVMIESEADPVFGEPMLLALGGLTIRDLAYSSARDTYYVLAGPLKGTGQARIYAWSGEAAAAPVDTGVTTPADFVAEALVLSDKGDRAFVTSDDGDRPIATEKPDECQTRADGTCRCDFLRERAKRHFRGVFVDLPAAAKPSS